MHLKNYSSYLPTTKTNVNITKWVSINPHLLSNPNSSHTHTGSNAHASHTNLLTRPLELCEKCADLSCASDAERVTESNSTALGVHLVDIEAKLIDAEETLRSEGLVDFPNINVVLGETGLFEDRGDGGGGAYAHEEGRHADDGGLNEFSEDGLAEALGSAALHEEDGGGAIGDLRGVAGVDGAVLCEGRADFGEGFSGDALSDAVVLVDGDGLLLVGLGVGPLDGQRSELLIEETLLLRLDSLLERGCGKGILS